jgi:hypothetical protein
MVIREGFRSSLVFCELVSNSVVFHGIQVGIHGGVVLDRDQGVWHRDVGCVGGILDRLLELRLRLRPEPPRDIVCDVSVGSSSMTSSGRRLSGFPLQI